MFQQLSTGSKHDAPADNYHKPNNMSPYSDYSADQLPIPNYTPIPPVDDIPQHHNNQQSYNNNSSRGQSGIVDYIDITLDTLIQQLNNHSKDRALTICDYGCATGLNSIKFIHSLIKHIYNNDNIYNQLCPAQNDITIIHSDQLGNSFDQLFDNIDSSNYYDIDSINNSKQSKIYTYASAISFFHQVAPKNTVSIGFTQATLHWLSSLPCNLRDSFHSVYAADHEKIQFAQQAALDWLTLLQHRSAELVDGGVLLLSLYCTSNDETASNSFNTTHHAINIVLKSMVEDGIITHDELTAATSPMYYRSESEYLEPSVLQRCSFNVILHQQVQLNNPMYQSYQESGKKQLFAQQHTNWVKSWTLNTFVNAFNNDQQQSHKIDIIYSRLQEYVSYNPDQFNGKPNIVYLILQKQGKYTPVPSSSIEQPSASTKNAAAAGAMVLGSLASNTQQSPPQNDNNTKLLDYNNQSIKVHRSGILSGSDEYNLHDIMYYTLESALTTGDAIEQGYFSSDKSQAELHNTQSLVETLVVNNIQHHYPHCRIVTQSTYDESQFDHSDNALTFYISTIEGYNNYIHKSPFHCISIAVQANRKLLAGVVHAPILGTTYHAVDGHGAYVSNFRQSKANSNYSDNTIAGYAQVHRSQLQCSNVSELHHALIRTELHYNAPQSEIDHTLTDIRSLMQHDVSSIRCIGCIPLNLCSVAMGSTDCYYEPKYSDDTAGLAPWSVAAGTVIVREAGGVVCDTSSTDINDIFNGRILAAANNKLAQSVINVINVDSNGTIDSSHQADRVVPPAASTLNAAAAGAALANQLTSHQPYVQPNQATQNAANAGANTLNQLHQVPSQSSQPNYITPPNQNTQSTANAGADMLNQLNSQRPYNNYNVPPNQASLNSANAGADVLNRMNLPPQQPYNNYNPAAPSQSTQRAANSGANVLNQMNQSQQSYRSQQAPPLPQSIPPTRRSNVPPNLPQAPPPTHQPTGYKLGQYNK